MTATHPPTTVCALAALQPERGAAALLADGTQVAVFRLHDGSVHAIGNLDPLSGAAVLARGIVGDRAGTPVVHSPVYKHAYDLTTGHCLDAPSFSVPVHRVSVIDGTILVHAA